MDLYVSANSNRTASNYSKMYQLALREEEGTSSCTNMMYYIPTRFHAWLHFLFNFCILFEWRMMMDRYIDFIINNERLVNNVIHYYIIHNKKIDDNAPLLLAASPATTFLSLFTITNFISWMVESAVSYRLAWYHLVPAKSAIIGIYLFYRLTIRSLFIFNY